MISVGLMARWVLLVVKFDDLGINIVTSEATIASNLESEYVSDERDAEERNDVERMQMRVCHDASLGVSSRGTRLFYSLSCKLSTASFACAALTSFLYHVHESRFFSDKIYL